MDEKRWFLSLNASYLTIYPSYKIHKLLYLKGYSRVFLKTFGFEYLPSFERTSSGIKACLYIIISRSFLTSHSTTLWTNFYWTLAPHPPQVDKNWHLTYLHISMPNKRVGWKNWWVGWRVNIFFSVSVSVSFCMLPYLHFFHPTRLFGTQE